MEQKLRVEYGCPGSPLAKSVNRSGTGAYVVYINDYAELVTESAELADRAFQTVVDDCIVEDCCLTRTPTWKETVAKNQHTLNPF